MISQNTPNKLSRRNWLRNAAITTTGAALLPSLLTGCSYIDDVVPNLGNTPPLTPAEFDLYSQAAENLLRMRKWWNEVYDTTNPYIFGIYSTIQAGEKETSLSDIFLDILSDFGVGLLEAALEEFPGVGPAVAASIKGFEKWGSEEKRNRVAGAAGRFSIKYGEMHTVVRNHLSDLADDTDSFKNLRDAFKGGDLEFNGRKYSLLELARNRFPGDATTPEINQYNKMVANTEHKFKKLFWNYMFLTAGELKGDYVGYDDVKHPTRYAEDYYKDHPADYLRGYYWKSRVNVNSYGQYYYRWHFTFDGKELTSDAAAILFKDKTPGNIDNPAGLFTRDYVFKQFVKEQNTFTIASAFSTDHYYEIRKDTNKGPCSDRTQFDYEPCAYFDPEGDNYLFSKGEFPKFL